MGERSYSPGSNSPCNQALGHENAMMHRVFYSYDRLLARRIDFFIYTHASRYYKKLFSRQPLSQAFNIPESGLFADFVKQLKNERACANTII